MLNERCLEMDLYWFQNGRPADRAKELFDRIAPLYAEDETSRNGLSLCVGWLFDSVLYWNGDLDAPIPTCQAPTYEVWTYRRLQTLLAAVKEEAGSRGIPNFYCALALLGGETMAYHAENTCEGWSGRTQELVHRAHYNIEGKWFYSHSEINKSRLGIFDWNAAVKVEDNDRFFAGTAPTFTEFFAVKLADMCRTVGFGGVILRDAVFMPSYIRGAAKRYKPDGLRQEITQAFITCFGRIKQLYPEFLIVGYDSGTGAMEQLRSHGFDLEQIAASGYLDMWITQTWASAWQDYWPANAMGYTFQLQSLLAEAAMLSRTPCKHLFLIETFDAWEPWDSIHSYPDKVYWEMLAYSHVGVHTGSGLTCTEGCYISWMNRGETLISDQDVNMIHGTLESVEEERRNRNPIPGGACIIYSREGIRQSLVREGECSRGEEFDDWCAMMQKYGAPILSAVRAEELDQAQRAECYLCPTVCTADPRVEAFLMQCIGDDIPVMLLGAADEVSPALRRRLNLQVHEAVCPGYPISGRVGALYQEGVRTAAVVLNQRRQTMQTGEDWESVIETDYGPVLARHRKVRVVLWETPEWGTPFELHLTYQSVQSPQTYMLAAGLLAGFCRIRWEHRDLQKPENLLYWKESDGIRVLLGNLETGYLGNSQFAVKGILHYPEDLTPECGRAYGFGRIYSQSAGRTDAAIAPHCVTTAVLKK